MWSGARDIGIIESDDLASLSCYLRADFIWIIIRPIRTCKIIIQLTRDVTELSNKLRFNMIHKNIIQNRNEKTLDGPQVDLGHIYELCR